MLNDHSGLEILRDPLETIDTRQRGRAIRVEGGHPVALIVLAEVRQIITEPSPNTSLSAASGSALLPPLFHGAKFGGGGSEFRIVERIPIAFADKQRRMREEPSLPRVVAVTGTDANVLHTRRQELEPSQHVHQAQRGRVRAAPHTGERHCRGSLRGHVR